jgi:hypothetical protein
VITDLKKQLISVKKINNAGYEFMKMGLLILHTPLIYAYQTTFIGITGSSWPIESSILLWPQTGVSPTEVGK